jgi:membrane-associated phospholipid phosphatase
MDIQVLLALQSFRDTLPEGVSKGIATFSDLAVSVLLFAVIAIVYWAFDKRKGTIIASSIVFADFLGNFVKICACVYRPWIRSSDIHPAEAALANATGYSFPSGHSFVGTAAFGSMGWCARKSAKWLTVILWLLIPMFMLSRLMLGVHTPQDVLVGCLVGILSIAASVAFVRRTFDDHSHDVKILVGTLILIVVTVAFATLKPYPMDYVDGVLLVDPSKMYLDFTKESGTLLGFVLGWFLERRFLDFKIPDNTRARVLRVIVGLVIVAACFGAGRFLGAALPIEGASKIAERAFAVFGIMFLAPAVFTRVVPAKAREE